MIGTRDGRPESLEGLGEDLARRAPAGVDSSSSLTPASYCSDPGMFASATMLQGNSSLDTETKLLQVRGTALFVSR